MKRIITLLLFTLSLLSINAQEKEKPVTNQKYFKVTTANISEEQALNEFKKEFRLNDKTQFKSLYTSQDKSGTNHHKFQQFYNNLKVEYGVAITHGKNGQTTSVNGELYNANNINTTPQLSADQALEMAKQNINASHYLWENAEEAQLMKYQKPSGELVVFPNLKDNTVHLAYKLDIYATQPVSRQIVYVDAHSGEILFKNAIIKHLNEYANSADKHFGKKSALLTAGTAATRYSGSRTIETDYTGTNFRLRDFTRGNGVITLNCQTNTSYQNAVDFTDNDNAWTSIEYNNGTKDNGALDAHWGAERTYDFWSDVFGRNSFDDNGAAIRSYVHYDSDYNNAFWNGAVMTYGDGNGLDIFTSIDICGHEIGHAICTYTADLVYENEPGAMNEGFSDIWGACIEHYGRTGSMSGTVNSNVWLIAEDLSSGYFRSMQNPNATGDPDTYLGTYWYSGSNDYGGVHTNSGVLNHWFYILAAGESGTNNAPSPDTYSVTGIGLAEAAEIAYLMERDYLTSNATYADARTASIEVANNLYCGNGPEVMAVTNAWYAVNVGEAFSSVADDVYLVQVQKPTTINCNGVTSTASPILTFKNQGNNVISTINISYTIDGGSVNNTTWNGSIAPCESIDYSLPITGMSRGAHTVQITATVPNDGRSENNTRSVIVLVDDQGTVGVANPFTTTSNILITYNESSSEEPWERGVKLSGQLSSGNGNYVYTTNLTGNYTDMTKKYLVSQCYNLSNVSNPMISFDMKYDLELNWDVVYVEYSTNFGANWTVLGTMTTGWYNSDRTLASSEGNDCYNCPGAQWTGSNTTNTNYSHPLTALNNETSVIFRIVFHSDEAVNQLGVNIDNFLISGTLSAESFEANSVVVYPNPSKGIFNINFGVLEATGIEVYDISGKKVYTQEGISTTETTLNLSSAAQGIYFVKINTNSQPVVKRIVKE